MRRSVNVELDLEEGEYQVRVKVVATRQETFLPIDQVIRNNAKDRRDKLLRVGLAYDLAHGKGQFVETSTEKTTREARKQRLEEKERQSVKDKILASREEAHYLKIKKHERDQKKLAKKKPKQKKGK